MSEDLRSLASSPFDLLTAIESRVRSTRPDVVRQRDDVWLGLGFRLREHWCVAPREDVREIIPLPAMSRTPGGKPWLMGVANVRGNILAVADLAQFLGLPHQSPAGSARVLIFNSTRMPVGFLVDEVAGYRQFTAGEQQPDARAAAGPLTPYLLGAFEREQRAWLALSLHRLSVDPEFAHAGY
jgi:twitching motility protein PilI